MEDGNKTKSINTALIALNAFLHWCMDNDYCNRFKTKLVKQDEIIKDTYSEEQLLKLLKKPNIKKCNFAEYRNWVIINYLVSTGNRSNTIINIQIKDLDLYNQVVKLTTKYQEMSTIHSQENYKNVKNTLRCGYQKSKIA